MEKQIIEHFRKTDELLFSLLMKIGTFEKRVYPKPDGYFSALCGIIIEQQLSGKAADTIFDRFVKLFTGKKITPGNLLKIPDDKLRSSGMSWSKVRFIKDLAKKVKGKTLQLDKLGNLTDNEIITELTKVKGIGPWTAEMFLMFTLGRPDVFSHGDLGLRKAIKNIYRFKKEPTRKQIEKIVSKWSPYRTYASRILWKSLELDL